MSWWRPFIKAISKSEVSTLKTRYKDSTIPTAEQYNTVYFATRTLATQTDAAKKLFFSGILLLAVRLQWKGCACLKKLKNWNNTGQIKQVVTASLWKERIDVDYRKHSGQHTASPPNQHSVQNCSNQWLRGGGKFCLEYCGSIEITMLSEKNMSAAEKFSLPLSYCYVNYVCVPYGAFMTPELFWSSLVEDPFNKFEKEALI